MGMRYKAFHIPNKGEQERRKESNMRFKEYMYIFSFQRWQFGCHGRRGDISGVVSGGGEDDNDDEFRIQ